MNIPDKFGKIIKKLIGNDDETGSLTGIHIEKQFKPDDRTDEAVLRNLNAAFLISLCGHSSPYLQKAEKFINRIEKKSAYNQLANFYRLGIERILSEMSNHYRNDRHFQENLEILYHLVENNKMPLDRVQAVKQVWQIFFPEGTKLLDNPKQKVIELRNRRQIHITHLNEFPIRAPVREILFTSNVLLTLPPQNLDLEALGFSEKTIASLQKASEEQQLYWYDHPVQFGADFRHNEVVYGLKGLNQAVEFEKNRGNVKAYNRLNCVLSVSVTHPGLRDTARAFIEKSIKQAGMLGHLNVYAFTESDTKKLVDEFFIPAAAYYTGKSKGEVLGYYYFYTFLGHCPCKYNNINSYKNDIILPKRF